MTKKHGLVFRSIVWLASVFILAALWGCAPKTLPKPGDESQTAEEPAPDPDETKMQTAALVDMLVAEAQKFMEQNDVKQAFLTYNRAMARKPDAPQKEKVLSEVEQLLTKADPRLIEAFLHIPDLAVPESLLLYRLGVNHSAARNYDEALAALTRFVDTYPGHPQTSDAQELITLIRQTIFKKDTIGCLLPMSGKYAIFGQKALKGIQMAIQDLSHTHDRNFNIIVKDTRSDPQRAAACVDELVRAHVMGIIGPLIAVETAGARAQALQIPLIALTQKTDFPQAGEYLFSNFITPRMQVETLAAYVVKRLGLLKVAVLYPDERYGELHMQLFQDMVNTYNGQIVAVQAYDGSRTDFAAPIRKLIEAASPYAEAVFPYAEVSPSGTATVTDLQNSEQNTDPDQTEKVAIGFDALFIPDAVSRINLILPQLVFNDARGMVLLGTNLWHQQSLLAETKGYNRNTVITDGYFGKSTKPATARFEKAFTALYGASPGFLEAVSYDTVQMLFQTAMDSGVDSRQLLKDALIEGRLFEGATGTTIFDKTGAARKELFLITIKNNQFEEIIP